MKFVSDLLVELGYRHEDSFEVAYECDGPDQDSLEISIDVYISLGINRQAYLVAKCKEGELYLFAESGNRSLVELIAYQFRLRECNSSDLDKNTFLLILSQQEDGQDVSSMIRIEDDPYYFKKSVFSYTKEDLEAVDNLNIEEGELVDYINNYVLDPEEFSAFKMGKSSKAGDGNQTRVYSFMMELVVKISCFPILEKNEEKLKEKPKPVKDYIDKNDTEKLEVSLDMIDKYLNNEFFSKMNSNQNLELNIDEACNVWKQIVGKDELV